MVKYHKYVFEWRRKMALKINGVGRPLTNFVYSVAQTNNASIFLTIKYTHTSGYKIIINRIRVYEFVTDQRHPNITAITQQIATLLAKAQSNKIVIKEDKTRNYIDITDGRQYYQYTGYSI